MNQLSYICDTYVGAPFRVFDRELKLTQMIFELSTTHLAFTNIQSDKANLTTSKQEKQKRRSR
jgi:hypothetical protein